MDYFYSPPEKISKHAVEIDGEEFSHLVHVMRKKEGDEIRVVDGKGMAYDVLLETIQKKTAQGKICASYSHHHEPDVEVTLAVGVLKNPSKFDFLVEKVTELGVNRIIPMRTERTIPSHAKVDRWQKLALAAMKQSGRSCLPEISGLVNINDFIDGNDQFDVRLLAHEKSIEDHVKKSPSQKPKKRVSILVGPEGGFSDDEVGRCLAAGYQPVYLGERRFRTETAAIVMTARIILADSK